MLIGITGKKDSGKDTFAEAIPATTIKMAGTLKNMLRTLFREGGLDEETIERKIEGDLKEEACEVLMGATPRWAMQALGTDWARMVDPTHRIWARIWIGKAAEALFDGGEPVVCTDIRFQHEVAAVQALGGYVVRVERTGQTSDDNHASETEMDQLEVDRTIQNDGSIEDLHEKARQFYKEISQ